MQKIYKYNFHLADEVSIPMPKGARVLTVQVQRGELCLWAIVDPTGPLENRIFHIFGTGHDMGSRDYRLWRHIGTFQLAQGDFIGHMFEETR